MIDVCVRCGQSYRAEDNRDDVCVYHPGWVMDYDRVGRRGPGLPGDFWDCCSVTVETTPSDVPGCARGPHVEAEPQPERGRPPRWSVERTNLAERRTVAFLRGTGDPGPLDAPQWRHLLADVRILEDDRRDTLSDFLWDPLYEAARRQALRPLLRNESKARDDWGLNRLFAVFPALRPERLGAASRPLGSASGSARIADEESRQEADIALTIAPADSFVVRLGVSLPDGPRVPRQTVAAEICRGILKGALQLVTPPALFCKVQVTAIAYAPGVSPRLLQTAAYRAFGEAIGRCEWTAAGECRD